MMLVGQRPWRPWRRANARAAKVPTAAAAAAASAAAAATTDDRARARAAAEVLSHLRRRKGDAAASAPLEAGGTLHGCVHVLPCPPAPPAWHELSAAVARAPASRAAAAAAAAAHLLARGRYVVLPEEGAGGCYLARRPWVHALRDRELALWLRALFSAACDPEAWRAAGLFDNSSSSSSSSSDGNDGGGGGLGAGPLPPRLSRFDLWHAHMFAAHAAPSDGSGDGGGVAMMESGGGRGGVGLLFHAREYPAAAGGFPHDLGHCQAGSNLRVTPRCMDTRNLLFFENTLAVLDVGPDSPLHAALLHPGTAPLRTVYEENFGPPLVDVLCLPPGGDTDGRGRSMSSSGSSSSGSSSSTTWSVPARDGEAWFHFFRPPDACDVFVSY